MCYGMNCKYELSSGECGKKSTDICPETLVICDGCEESFEDGELVEVRIKGTQTNIFVCENCSEDTEKYILIL